MNNEKWFLWAICQIKAYQFDNLAPGFNEKCKMKNVVGY
jgi:hypothetical protein